MTIMRVRHPKWKASLLSLYLIHLADTYQVASCLADTKEAQACLLNQKSDGVFFTPEIYRGHTAKIYRGRVGVGVARLARLWLC
jgi:hypothetical protein